MSKNYIIFGRTYKRAEYKLNEIFKSFDPNEILQRSRNMFSLKNGDVYKAVGTNDSSRGYKPDCVFVDQEISLDIFHNIILPCISHKAESEIKYY
jgi:hypothetical protein